MKSPEDKQLGFLFDSLEGEAWQIQDSPHELVSFYNIAQEGQISIKNQITEISWDINHQHCSNSEYPVFQTISDAEMHLQVDKHRCKKQLIALRNSLAESITLKVPLEKRYWHHIQTLTSKFKTIQPKLNHQACKHQCLCEGCAKKQISIRNNPTEHPFHAVLENIHHSNEDYFFRLEGKTQRAVVKINPERMQTKNGVCTIQTTLSKIQIDLSQLFFIRVEQQTFDGVPYSVLQGKSHDQELCFTIYSPVVSHYQKWTELVTQTKLVH